jgi:hypothetical protein
MHQESTPLTIYMIAWFVFILSFVCLLYAYSCYRTLRYRSQSKVSSLPQGIVNVSGLAKYHTKGPLISPYSKTECCYYKAVTRSKYRSLPVATETSKEPFILSDDGAECLVLPEKAVFFDNLFRVQKFRDGYYRYTEILVLQDAKVFIEGFCSTIESFDADNGKPIIRAPNRKTDKVDFEFIISSVSKEFVIQKYYKWSIVLLLSMLGSGIVLLGHYFLR